jgi:hypothetical protein
MSEFTNQQRKALRKLQGRLPYCTQGIGKVESFTLHYISFEAQARKIWHYYRCRKKVQKESKAGIPLGELIKGLKYFEIQFDNDKIHRLLDSNLRTRKRKSARNLRNGIVHQWLEEDCKEVETRYEEFIDCIEEFSASLGRVL